MSRYRLRYQSGNLEMPPGDFVVGRSSECNLSIDDASVSRRHATLRVSPHQVTLIDLGSRNGVRVNGTSVTGESRLTHLDKIVIGNQEMIFVDSEHGAGRHAPTSDLIRCTACGAIHMSQATTCEQCGAAIGDPTPPPDGQTVELRFATGDDGAKADAAFLLVAGIADKALALGSFDKAEQILAPHLDMMVLRAQRGDIPAPDALDRAIVFALRLAEERNARRWLQWVIIVHTAGRRVMSAGTIDRLHEAVRRVRYTDGRALRDYLAQLRPLEEKLSPGDRFLIKRLEALLRVVTA